MSIPITPDTKVGALLEAYPGIEELLIARVPAFEKLRNPILRKTVAKVASLDQAARMGGIGVRELVCTLRKAVGQEPGDELPAEETASPPSSLPAWAAAGQERFVIDADSMLAAGVHPIGKVRQCSASLKPKEFLKLTSSFRPEPLLDAMSESGYAVYSHETSPGSHVTYIGSAKAQG